MSGEPDVSGTVFDEESAGLARNYADALLTAAEKGDQVDAILDELDELVDDLYIHNDRTRALLSSPTISPLDRDRFLVSALDGRAMPMVVQFLRVLNKHGRLALLPTMARAARATWDRRQNRVHVSVRSAVPLDDAQKSALHDRVAGMVGATPILDYSVDPALIGGLVLQVGDDVFDASVKTRLEQMRRRLIEEKSAEIRSRSAQLIF